MFRHASLNRSYSLAWNEAQQAFVPAPETARRRGKRSGTVLAAAVAAIFSAGVAHAIDANTLPTGGKVTAGQAAIGQTGNTTTVQQQSTKAAIDWQSFSIGRDANVRFVQPSASAIVLNRVVGQDPTQILGSLNANGQVFIVNPSGVLFARGAQVSAAGVLASTRHIATHDFMAGRLTLSGNSAGTVVNQGRIDAATGGYVVLVGAQVVNSGAITAPQGDVRLAAANQVTLAIDHGGLVGFSVDQGTVDALAMNGGLIKADGGRIFMTADALDQLSKAVVNNQGVIEAQTVQNRNGTIVLMGDMQSGTTMAGGTLDASAPHGGDGGFIETSAAHVKVVDGHLVTTKSAHGRAGTWLIDPTDFTIAASGGDTTGAQLSTDLATGNVTIQSTAGANGATGNVNVNDTVSWSANKLTLNAQNDVNINANMTGSGTASLAFEYGQNALAAGNTSVYTLADNVTIDLPGGNNFSTRQGSDGLTKTFYVLRGLGSEGSVTRTHLQGIQGDLTGNYALGGNLDASATIVWEFNFIPLGTSGGPFSGNFEGLGHTIDALKINTSGGNVGLFGELAAGSRVSNVKLATIDVRGGTGDAVGGVIGRNFGTVDHVSVDGAVKARDSVGGLVGLNEGVVHRSSSNANATGRLMVGGLVGTNTSEGVIAQSSSGGNAAGFSQIGGLVGNNAAPLSNLHSSAGVAAEGSEAGGLVGHSTGTVSDSSATGNVHATDTAGGLIGFTDQLVSNSHAGGSVDGAQDKVGGLLGSSAGGVSNSYATGAVSGGSSVGGLVGLATGGSVTDSHAEGAVSASDDSVGGLIGKAQISAIGNSYATGSVDGMAEVGGLVGRWVGNIASPGELLSSHATGTVSGITGVGGLVGNMSDCECLVADSNATGNVAASGSYAGGLVGDAVLATIRRSFATGAVAGADHVGGLAGRALNVEDSHAGGSVTGQNNTGGLIGKEETGGVISASYATGSVIGTENVGGLVGHNLGEISGSATGHGGVAGSVVKGDTVVGGLVGRNEGQIHDSAATGDVEGGDVTGGLAGSNTSAIVDSTASGSVSGASNTGGLVGVSEDGASVASSSASGAVAGSTNVGGLVGHNLGEISGSATGHGSMAGSTVSGIDQVGGLVGYNEGQIAGSAATGDVVGGELIGGLVGANDASIVDSTASGKVSGATYTGGLVGYNDQGASVSGSSASGAVSGTQSVGGLMGYNEEGAVISASFATGDVTGTDVNVGGLVGQNLGVIEGQSYATGRVTGTDAVGGLVGVNEGEIRDAATGHAGVAGQTVTGGWYVGGLVGDNYGPIVDSTATGDVVGDENVGGLVGFADPGSSIANSSASGAVSGAWGVGGLVGTSWESTIERSHATGTVTGDTAIGGLVGYGDGDSHVSDSSASGAVTGSEDVGGLMGYNEETAVVSASFATGSVTATTAAAGGLVGRNLGSIEGNSYSTSVVVGNESVGGLVGVNAGEIRDAATGHAGVAGPVVTGTLSVGGLVGVNAGNIADSTATGDVLGSANTGGLAGVNDTGARITGSSASGAVSGVENTGGLVAYNTGAIADSAATGNVSGFSNTGGLVGNNDGGASIDSSSASGTVTGAGNVGGLVGYNARAIDGSTATGDVSGTLHVGGFIGTNDYGSQVTGSSASGAVTGASEVGGFVGRNSATLSGNAVDGNTGTGSVTASVGQAGGFAGVNEGHISDVTTTNPVSSTGAGGQDFGGIVGLNTRLLEESRALNSVTTTANNTGGAVGSNVLPGTITTTYAANTVSGQDAVGGLVGFNDGEISIAYASGSVTGRDRVGGLVGRAEGAIINAYSTGAVTGRDVVGGLFGWLNGYAQFVYASGAVTAATARVGGLVAEVAEAYLADAFYNQTTTGQSNPIGQARTTAEMQTSATFAGWDLSTSGSHDTPWRSYEGLASPLLVHWLTPLAITTDNAAISHVYDGSQRTAVPGIVFTESLAPGHLFGSAAYSGKNVGVYTAIDGHYSDQQGYDITYVHHGSLTITPAPLTASLVGVSKTYDGTTAATLGAGNFMFSGFIDGEGATATAIGAYNSKNVIDANSVGTSLLEGDFTAAPETLLGNYSLPTTAAGSGFITPKSVDVSATASNKVYDAGTLVDAHLAVSGVLENDSAGVTGTARFADKNAGTGKQVTVSDIALSGPDAGNYAVSTPSVLTVADITPKPISVAATGIDKTYDGNTKATAAMTSDDVIAGDSIDFDADASFADKNAGADKRVSVNNIRGAGPDAGNYLLLNTSGKTTAGIARKAITVDASSADKTYDGTTAASVALGSGGVVEGDAVSFSGTGAFADKNAGADKRVSVSGIATAGDDSANYLVLDTTAATTATIAPKAITVDATGIAKTYDGTLTGSVLLRANGVIEGDSVSFDGSVTFADKNVGVGKALVVGGISGTGADAANYAYGSTTGTTADITPRALTVTLKGLVAKIADGSTDAVLGGGHFNVAGVVDGESVGISQTAGTFDTGATGSGKLVTTSLSLADYLAGGNTSLGNYFLFTGDLSDAIGSILPPLAFTSALASLPNIPSGAGPGNRLVATASSPDDSVADKADLDALAPALASAVSGNTKENLLLRRTFSIGDGGIRLPQGVRGSEKDASQ